jgi:hypothetical protein
MHEHRPCVDWARRSVANYRWLVSLMGGLIDQYHTRFNKAHSYQGIYELFYKYQPLNISMAELTPFEQGVPAQYRRSNAVQAYREYYFNECGNGAKWTVVGMPTWWARMCSDRETVHG